MSFSLSGYQIFTGHFHTSTLTDILWLAPGFAKIYWADENGNYDNTRYTQLDFEPRGSGNFAGEYNVFDPYIAHLTSDTVDDLILCYDVAWVHELGSDSNYCVLYKGGVNLYRPDSTILNDEAIYANIPPTGGRRGISGYFLGSGREDYLATDGINLFLYKNDKPFSLAQFASAMSNDTLYAAWQNPDIPIPKTREYWDLRSISVLPHGMGDSACDLEGSLIRGGNDSSWSANIWRGGPTFGSSRITANDTTLCIRSPFYYDPSLWYGMSFGGIPIDCGDMTGTGNKVIMIGGGDGSQAYEFFYVMGNAADPLVDMYFSMPDGAGGVDTITADSDLLEDIIMGNSWLGQDGESRQAGGILVVHGSRKIPVRLNRNLVRQNNPELEGHLTVSPNPFSRHTVVTWESACSGSVEVRLIDLLGRTVYQETRRTTGDLESFSLDLPSLPAGEYFLELVQDPCSQHASLIITS
jgi:hypothetical protein